MGRREKLYQPKKLMYTSGLPMSLDPSKDILRLDKLISSSRLSPRAFRAFARSFYRRHGRSFPWRDTRDPYRILVSEIMLQQTQTDRVKPKYRAFMREFPTWRALASASTQDVMRAWQGLGYYRRAFNLHRAAQSVQNDHGGKLPADVEVIRGLPGVGAYTAGAVAAFAFGIASPIIETNIRSVYLYAFFPRRRRVSDSELMQLIEQTLDRASPREWYYALMDLGSELKKQHRGINARSKHHTKQSSYEGSNRQARAAILRALAHRGPLTEPSLRRELGMEPQRIARAISGLLDEGLVRQPGRGRLSLP